MMYDKPLPPDEVVRRAEVWKEVFDAKDGRRPVRVKINRHVRDDIYEVFYKDVVKGLLKSPKQHEVGEEVDAIVVISDYATKTFRTRLYDPERDVILKVGDIVEAKVKRVTNRGGFTVQIRNLTATVPKRYIGKAMRYPIRELRKGRLVCEVVRLGKKGPILRVIDVKI